MNDSDNETFVFETLRQHAETLLQQQPAVAPDFPPDILELIHEIKVHHTELKIQNEELKRAQQEISELSNEYEDLYEFAPCGYLTLNSKGIITRSNLTAVKLIGPTRRLLQHKSFTQFVDKKDESDWLAAQRNAAESGKKQTVNIQLKSDKAFSPVVRAEITADIDDANVVLQWRIILVDLTEEYKTRKEKEEITKELMQSQKMESIGTLASGIAHEFNNLLQIIMGNTQLLLEVFPESNSVRANLERIQSASLRSKDIVKQLLTLSHKDDSPKKPLEFRSVVQKAIKLIRSSTPRQIDIIQRLPDNLYPVIGNETQINQILINLCGNAQDAMLDKEGTITIELSNDRFDENLAKNNSFLKPGRYLRLQVKDSGCGMDKNQLEKIFDPYFTTKEINKGTGIGLSVVYTIVKNHNGSIFVESEPGKGTIFTIFLPAYEGTLEPEIVIKESSKAKGNETILYIEDEPQILELGRKIMERVGYTVHCFEDPLEAVNTFKSSPDTYDLIVTDMAMPSMTGDRLILKIKEIRPNIPTILCTGYSPRIMEKSVANIGVSAFMMKPISLNEFVTCVRKVLDQS